MNVCSVVSLWHHGLLPIRLLCPWNFPGKNTGVGCYFLFQGIFLTQGSNSCLLHLLHWQADFLPPGEPSILTLLIIYYIQVFPIKTIRLLKISQQYFNAHFINKETIPRFWVDHIIHLVSKGVKTWTEASLVLNPYFFITSHCNCNLRNNR